MKSKKFIPFLNQNYRWNGMIILIGGQQICACFYLVSNLLFLLFHLDRHQIADEKQSSIPRLFYRTPNYAYEKNNLLVAS